MKRFLCVVMVFMVMMSLQLFVNATDIQSEAHMTKIDNVLLSKLNSMNDNDEVAVSVWFADVDRTVLKNKVITEVQRINREKSNSTTQNAVDLLFYDLENEVISSEEDLLALESTYSSVTTEEVNAVIELERKVASEMYEQHNKEILENLFVHESFIDEKTIFSEGNDIVKYICQYAPNVDMTLTKKQVLAIVESNDVQQVNYRSTNATATIVDYEIEDGLKNITSDSYDDSYFTTTGIATARDAWSLNGLNMKIGIIESSGYVIDNLKGLTDSASDAINRVNNVYLDENRTNESAHASSIAYLMVGNLREEDSNGNVINEYVGAVPNAKLFVTAINKDIEKIKMATDALIAEGVSVISSSCGFYEEGITSAYYSDVAKWYDYLSVNRNIHYALCSGNYIKELGPFQVPHSNNAHNAVVVGNCNSDGELFVGTQSSGYITPPYRDASLYNIGTTVSYKPDVVAPGTLLKVPMYSYGITGTSYSTPLVASAMLQLAQESPVLQVNPTLMKSIVISSTKIKSSMFGEPMYSTIDDSNIAYSKSYGAGMLSVTNAYKVVNESNYYSNEFTPQTLTATYHKGVTKSIGKDVRVCLAWDKVAAVGNENDFSSVDDETLDCLTLRVTTPSGVMYTSSYQYDNKQMITFESTENGTYSFTVLRQNLLSSNYTIDYSISWSLQ